MRRLRSIAIVIALIASATRARAQGGRKSTASHVKQPPGLSTLSGVYTDAQASRGKDVYAGACRSCHTPASHTGATFIKWWRGKQLSDLFGFISANMPKNDPGSLAPEDAADVTAYLLKMNAMPVGTAELPPDIDSLKKFRIETKPSRQSPAKRKKP